MAQRRSAHSVVTSARRRRRLQPWLCCLFALLLSACVTAPPTPGRSWQQQRAQVQEMALWALDGKVAARSPEGAQSASFAWRQSALQLGARSELTLQGPLGAGAVRIVLEGDALTITEGGQTTAYAGDANAAMARATGWPVPARALGWWLRALPAPATTAVAGPRQAEPHSDAELHFDAGWPVLLEQDGWRVHYQAWTDVQGLRLPNRLLLEHAEQGLEVRLIASRWRLPDA